MSPINERDPTMRPAPQQLRASVRGQFVQVGHEPIFAYSTDSRVSVDTYAGLPCLQLEPEVDEACRCAGPAAGR